MEGFPTDSGLPPIDSGNNGLICGRPESAITLAGVRASPIVLGHPTDGVRLVKVSQKSLPCVRRVLARPSRRVL